MYISPTGFFEGHSAALKAILHGQPISITANKTTDVRSQFPHGGWNSRSEDVIYHATKIHLYKGFYKAEKGVGYTKHH